MFIAVVVGFTALWGKKNHHFDKNIKEQTVQDIVQISIFISEDLQIQNSEYFCLRTPGLGMCGDMPLLPLILSSILTTNFKDVFHRRKSTSYLRKQSRTNAQGGTSITAASVHTGF